MKLTKKPEKSSTGMAVTGPTKVATWGAEATGGHIPAHSCTSHGQHFPPPQIGMGPLATLHGAGKAPSDLQGSGSSSDEKPEGLGHQGRGGGQGGEEQEARGLGGLARHPVHDAAVGDGADHLHGHRDTSLLHPRPSSPHRASWGRQGPLHGQPGALGRNWLCHGRLVGIRGVVKSTASSPGRAHLPWSLPGNRL